jgi:hypothetical protein
LELSLALQLAENWVSRWDELMVTQMAVQKALPLALCSEQSLAFQLALNWVCC